MTTTKPEVPRTHIPHNKPHGFHSHQHRTTDEDVLRGHDSPFYFNGGELLIAVAIQAMSTTFALSFWSSMSKSFESIHFGNSDDTLLGAWISTIIIVLIAIVMIVFLSMCKKQFMYMAYHTGFLHSHHSSWKINYNIQGKVRRGKKEKKNQIRARKKNQGSTFFRRLFCSSLCAQERLSCEQKWWSSYASGCKSTQLRIKCWSLLIQKLFSL